jgi:hypothetical protein
LTKRYCASRVVRRARGAETKPETRAAPSKPPETASRLSQILGRSSAQDFAAVVREREADLRMRERVVRDEVRQVKALGRLGAQEFAARGDVEEEVAHADGRPLRARRRRHVADAPALDENARPFGLAQLLRDQLDARDRGDGGQRFAAEAQGADAL